MLEHITEMLDNIYGDAEWCGSGGYVDDDKLKQTFLFVEKEMQNGEDKS